MRKAPRCACARRPVARIARAIESLGPGRARPTPCWCASRDDEDINAMVDEALAELAAQAAKREALLRAFEARRPQRAGVRRDVRHEAAAR